MMASEIKVPALGESVSEATVARWLKKLGDTVAVDDPLVELETDKVTLEVNAAAAGTLSEIVVPEGANVAVGAVLGRIGEGAGNAAAKPQPAAAGKDGRITKGDVLTRLERGAPAAPGAAAPAPRAARELGPREERVRMTRLRRRIAERLQEAQNNAAMLTTFNEADMSEVMALRERYRDSFEKKYAVKLGFMSFFVKACI